MTRIGAAAVAGGLLMACAGAAMGAEPVGKAVSLPGISYQVLGSGPADGPHPTRADTVTMRYVGRLTDGQIFSTSPGDGAQVSTFPVGQLIPGMSAALQLMRPGDRWRITMPPYLAYGPGRPLATPPPTAALGAQTVQKRGIPPNATLVFDVELVAIVTGKAP
ncbi:MAG TPA: FKBP-type peptidyl-prolyl cis-trans isomerase [Phenylobacterium sp.]